MKSETSKLRWQFWPGIAILVLLASSYLIQIPTQAGQTYVTYTHLLSLLIFYNPIILGLYILIAIILIFFGIKDKIRLI